LSHWAFRLTFAGVGLRTNIRELKAQGLRAFAVGAIGELLIALASQFGDDARGGESIQPVTA